MRIISLLVLQSILLCGGQVLLKLAMNRMGEFRFEFSFFMAQLTNWWFLGCGLSFLAATVLWLYILKNFPFGIAYPLTSLSYLFGIIAAMAVFHEQVTAGQWLGVILIMAGCALIVK